MITHASWTDFEAAFFLRKGVYRVNAERRVFLAMSLNPAPSSCVYPTSAMERRTGKRQAVGHPRPFVTVVIFPSGLTGCPVSLVRSRLIICVETPLVCVFPTCFFCTYHAVMWGVRSNVSLNLDKPVIVDRSMQQHDVRLNATKTTQLFPNPGSDFQYYGQGFCHISQGYFLRVPWLCRQRRRSRGLLRGIYGIRCGWNRFSSRTDTEQNKSNACIFVEKLLV